MIVYRRKTDGKRARSWTARFQHHGRRIQRGGFPDRETAEFWMTSEMLKLKRAEVGYIRPRLNMRVAPLAEQYAEHLEAMKRAEMYAYNTGRRLLRLAGEAGWMTLSDLTAQSFEAWRAEPGKWRGRKPGARTLNQYLDSAKQFCAWLIGQQLLAVNPLGDLRHLPTKQNVSFRRAATVEEINRLLAAAPESRRRVYLFAFYCPLRRASLARLRWEHVHLDGDRPFVEVPGELTKSGKLQRAALHHELERRLRRERGGAGSDDLVFESVPSVESLRIDLAAAGVPFSDRHGRRRLDLHAFRKTFVKLAKGAGVSMEQVGQALHHRTTATTRKWYDDDEVSPALTDAVERLPVVGQMKIG